ncbi:MAG TPA: hypothetical protein VE988_23065, partial [Gemmataceae bacterium]|nr:hypothetical protein [Gemmataceae bacterium]
MYTSIALLALTGSMVASSYHEDLTWQKDYATASQVGQTQKKPLAVFVGTGAMGHEKVCQDGKLSPEVQKTLSDSYVCVYVDVNTPAGQKLASDLNIKSGKGLVLSSRNGDLQAFAHDGDLSSADLGKWVTYGADPNLNVVTTMNNTTSRISMYPGNGSTVNYGSGYIIN